MPVFEDLPQRDALAEKIDALFHERVEQRATPGIRFAVFDRTGITFEGGHGNADAAGHPPAAHTRFRIASCTKSFTAAAILVLRDRGMLSLDTPVTHYVPALKPTLPEGRPEAPTVRMLLSMTGGLPTDDPWADRQESLSNTAFRAVLENGVRFATAPGTRYEYSNLGYALLGQVIEAVSGERYVDFVANHLLSPLGLHETGFDPLSIAPERTQILNLFKALKTDLGAGLLYVTHDLGVVAEFCDSLTVMYAGRTVEQSNDLAALIAAPAHPYTRALLAAVPRIKGPIRRLRGLASSAPSLTERDQTPAQALIPCGPGRQVAPFTAEDERFFARDEEV